jgi:hypothetical protein
VQSADLAAYLNKPEVQRILGIDAEWVGPWGADKGISAAFGGITGAGTLDVQHQTKLYISSLLEHGIRVLIYVRAVADCVPRERDEADLTSDPIGRPATSTLPATPPACAAGCAISSGRARPASATRPSSRGLSTEPRSRPASSGPALTPSSQAEALLLTHMPGRSEGPAARAF